MRLNLSIPFVSLLFCLCYLVSPTTLAFGQTVGNAKDEFVGSWNVAAVQVSPAVPDNEQDPWHYMMAKGWQVEFTADGKVRFAGESHFPQARFQVQGAEITITWPSVEAVTEPGRASGPAESSTLYTFRWEAGQLILHQDQGRFQRTIRLARG